jgi:hypothetical protein
MSHPLFGIRLIAVGPNHQEVLRLLRATGRGSRPPAEVKAEMDDGLPLVVCDNLEYHDVSKAAALFENAGATVEPYTAFPDYPI